LLRLSGGQQNMSAGGFKAQHLAIVGLGLMGGSMALALRPFVDKITAVEMDPATREYALKRGMVDRVTDDLKDGVSEADVVILAAPVRAILTMIRSRIGAYLRMNTLLIDIGSTKEDICNAMAILPIGVQAVGGHPMTGKEQSGCEASDATLYVNRPFVLCPSRRTTPATLLRARALADALGAVPIEMDAHRHDRVVAALVATVAQEAQTDDAVWTLAAGGFRDTSRLAAQDVQMMGDILGTNTQAVATLLAYFRVHLANIEAMLISQDSQQLADRLRPVREARLAWGERQENGKK
jgi:prephenate dehydrogenase